MPAREYLVIDAFTAQPFAGNPAAVVLDARGLTDDDMQRVAAEFNLSETTFVLPPSERAASGTAAPDVRFRWFTPTMEVNMCGHATIAGVRALFESGRLPSAGNGENRPLRIECRAGVLQAFVEPLPSNPAQPVIWLDLVDPTLTAVEIDRGELSAALRIERGAWAQELKAVRTQDDDVIAFVGDVITLNAARPDFPALSAWLTRARLRGLCLATVNTLTPAVAVQSRFFAPTAGVNEDPVTGSVHGPLAACLVANGLVETQDGVAGMQCSQGIPGGRTGLVWVLVQPGDSGRFGVRIGGQTVVSMRGSLTAV